MIQPSVSPALVLRRSASFVTMASICSDVTACWPSYGAGESACGAPSRIYKPTAASGSRIPRIDAVMVARRAGAVASLTCGEFGISSASSRARRSMAARDAAHCAWVIASRPSSASISASWSWYTVALRAEAGALVPGRGLRESSGVIKNSRATTIRKMQMATKMIMPVFLRVHLRAVLWRARARHPSALWGSATAHYGAAGC